MLPYSATHSHILSMDYFTNLLYLKSMVKGEIVLVSPMAMCHTSLSVNNNVHLLLMKNTYHAFYKGKQIELQAETSYQAQQLAAQQFKAKKSYDVTVVIVGRADGSEVVHVADF